MFRKPVQVDKQQLLRRLDKAWVAFKDSGAPTTRTRRLITSAWQNRDQDAFINR
jgi:hypothetical protein